jgi:hypothetical protein
MAQRRRVSSAFWVTLAALLLIAVLAAWGVIVSFAAGAGPPMGVHGWIAMGLAVVVSGGVGGGLMWLAFYSARHGYDDDVITPETSEQKFGRDL